MSALTQRFITAIIFGIVVLVPLYLSKISGALIIGILCLLTSVEYLQLQGFFKRKLIIPVAITVFIYGALVFIILDQGISWQIMYVIILGVLFGLLLLIRLYKRLSPFQFSFQIVPSILYIALPLSLLMAIANWQDNYQPLLLFAILFFIWINDIMAYLVGKNFGKHPFSSYISPNKTWEGTVAGWISCMLIALAFNTYLPQFNLLEWLTLGLVIGIFSTFGDLIESLFKRKKGIKDSGTFLPGHGGFLDRLDSMLFVLPFVGLFFLLFA